MIYICLILTCALIIIGAELIRRYSKKYKRAISFREALDLTGLPVITFAQGNNKFNFLFDTGATNSVINASVLDNIKHSVIEGAECEVYGIEGSIQKVNFVNIKFERDLTYEDNFQAVDMSSAFDQVKAETGVTVHGILGNTFFQKYKYIIDYVDMVVYSKI